MPGLALLFKKTVFRQNALAFQYFTFNLILDKKYINVNIPNDIYLAEG